MSHFKSTRIPRKLKKRVKKICGIHWSGLNNGQRLWYHLGIINTPYRDYLIKQITDT